LANKELAIKLYERMASVNCQECGVTGVEKAIFCQECGAMVKRKTTTVGPTNLNTIIDRYFFVFLLSGGLLFTTLAVYLALVSLTSDLLFSIIMAATGLCILLFSGFTACAFIYNSWSLLQNDVARTTAGKAVGFLLIPLFNLYWVFHAIRGFAVDYNRYANKHIPDAPRLPENIFLGFSVLFVLVPLFFFIPIISLALGLACWIYFIYLTLLTGSTIGAIAEPASSMAETAGLSRKTGNKANLFLSSLKNNKARLGGVTFFTIVILVFIVTPLIPRGQFSVRQLSVPQEMVHGERLIITADTDNFGKAAGTYFLSLYIDDRKIETKSVTIEARNSKAVHFDLSDDFPPGDYQASLGLGFFEVARDDYLQSFKILKPAELRINNLQLNPHQVDHTEKTRATVEVSNLGEAEGGMTLNLMIDNEVKKTEHITVKGETTITKDFILQIDDPGLYTVTANGTSKTLEVFVLDRPSNGTMLIREAGGGNGQLKISNNNSDADVLVVLADPDDPQTPLMAAYVHAESSYTMRGISDDKYLVYYSEGQNWDAHSKRFTDNARHSRFDDNIYYETTYVTEGHYYETWEVEIGIAGDEGAAAETIDSDYFPSLRQ